MQVLNISEKFSKLDFDLIVDFLSNEKVVVLNSDTIYGFSAKYSSKLAREKIIKLKKRSKQQKFVVLISSLAMLKNYCIVTDRQEDYLKNIWPGNITAILETKVNTSLALRLPKSDLLIKIIRKVGEPIISTSVNISGEPPILQGREIIKKWQFKKNQPDLIVLNKKIKTTRVSKIIDLRDISNIKIIRK